VAGDMSKAMTFGTEMAETLGMLQYSREHEAEADLEGLGLLYRAGLEPEAMINVFRKFEQQRSEPRGLQAYLSTHPRIKDRIAKLEAVVKKEPRPKLINWFGHYDWQMVKKMCDPK